MKAYKINNNIELFIDLFLVDKLDNVKLELKTPEKKEIVMEFDQPWEGETSGYVSVFQDGNITKNVLQRVRRREERCGGKQC